MRFDVAASIESQKRFCEEKELPHFAPNDGVCWNCNQNIYEDGKRYWMGNFENRDSQGVTTEKAASELITGCPHCNRSYCD